MSTNNPILKPSIHHAISLNDFKIYINNLAILSREKLSKENPYYTRFFSDSKDFSLKCWDRVFGNFTDFGARFVNLNGSNVPNAYGPITIIFKSDVFTNLNPDELKITKRTIAADGYDPGTDNIQLSELDKYFSPSANNKNYLNYPKPEHAAIEFSYPNKIPLTTEGIHKIIIDPITYNNTNLLDIVSTHVKQSKLNEIKIESRKLEQDKQYILDQLVAWSDSLHGCLLHKQVNLKDTVPSQLEQWYAGLSSTGKKILASWLTYTYNGTLLHMT